MGYNIRAVVFDLDGTLYEGFPKHGFPCPEIVDRAMDAARAGLDGDDSRKTVESLIEAFGIVENKSLRLFLEDLGCSIGVLTNSPKEWVDAVLCHLGVYDLFEGRVWTGDSAAKPGREAYTRVLDYFCFDAKKILFVEDEPSYLKPAKELGMLTALIGLEQRAYIDFNLDTIYNVADIVFK